MNNVPDIAIIGWHDGVAGALQAFLEAEKIYHVSCFVHPENDLPYIDIEKDRGRRAARRFDYPLGETFKGKPLLVSRDWAARLKSMGLRKVLVAYHDLEKRLDLIKEARGAGLELVSAIHPSAIIMQEAILEPGVIVFEGAKIGYRVEIGAGSYIGPSTFIGHHTVIKECAELNVVTLSGNVVVDNFAVLHPNSTVMAHVKIGKNAVVGIGSVVLGDVPEGATVFGNPAKRIPGSNKS